MSIIDLPIKVCIFEGTEQNLEVQEAVRSIKLVENAQSTSVMWMDILRFIANLNLLKKQSMISYLADGQIELLGQIHQISDSQSVEVKEEVLTLYIQYSQSVKEETVKYSDDSSDSSSSNDSLNLEKIETHKETVRQVALLTEKFNGLVYMNMLNNKNLKVYFTKKQIQHNVFRDQISLYQM